MFPGLPVTLSQSVRNCNWDAQQLQQYMQAHPGAACSYSELWARIKLLLARAVSAMPQVRVLVIQHYKITIT